MICLRSGLGFKHNLMIPNAPGIVDEGYKGEIRICIYNLSKQTYTIKEQERVAQLVIVPTEYNPIRLTGDNNIEDNIPYPILSFDFSQNPLLKSPFNPDRGEGGFGSSGQF